MDVHARESGSPMRSNLVAPTYASRDQGILFDRPRRGFDLFCGALLLALAAAGCNKKDDCQKAIDHLAHLSFVEGKKSLSEVAPEMRAEAEKMIPSEEMMLPKMREIGAKRFGTR